MMDERMLSWAGRDGKPEEEEGTVTGDIHSSSDTQ